MPQQKNLPRTAGMPPGTLLPGDESVVSAVILEYNPEQAVERKYIPGGAFQPAKGNISWIQVTGLNDPGLLEELGRSFSLHPLTLEDIQHSGQQPKIEDFGDYTFITLKALLGPDEDSSLVQEPVSIILGSSYVLSFQENASALFEPVRERLLAGKGRLRRQKAEYLTHALLDTVVDSYFGTLERIGEAIERLEEKLLVSTNRAILQRINLARQELLLMHKSVWHLREVAARLARGETLLVEEFAAPYYRDIHDHIIQIIDLIDSYREMLSGMLEIYLSSTGNRLNEIMKVLTIIATIFIPLTFITGMYGMNFHHMPELAWRWGYPAALLLMAGTAGAMLFYFRKKGWI
jgi:magnesium transporter